MKTFASLILMIALVPGAFAEGRDEDGNWEGRRCHQYFVESGSQEPGLVVVGVLEDSPAETVGIVRGDILMSVNGREVSSMMDIREALEGLKAGDMISLEYKHGDETRTTEMQLDDRLFRSPLGLALAPGSGPSFEFHRQGRGMTPMPHFDLPDFDWEAWEGAVIIVDVLEGSPAEEAGLDAGSVILTLNGQELAERDSLRDLVRSMSPGDVVELEVADADDETSTVTVTLGADDDGNAFLGVQYHAVPMGRFKFRMNPESRSDGSFWNRGNQDPQPQGQSDI